MAQEVTLGGERIGSGQKQKVELHNYGMTSFNLEQDFKSSMAPGVLYPFIKMVGTNHGTFDIDLDSFVRTIPTKGPLFGSFKLQLDLYSVPWRLYQGILHNNPISLGMNMDKVYTPKLEVKTFDGATASRVKGSNDYNFQINDSCLLKYLGLSGLGHHADYNYQDRQIARRINAIPALAYYDIFKVYYANKQEEKAYVLTPQDRAEMETAGIINPISIASYEETGQLIENINLNETHNFEWSYEAPYQLRLYINMSNKRYDLILIGTDDENISLDKIIENNYGTIIDEGKYNFGDGTELDGKYHIGIDFNNNILNYFEHIEDNNYRFKIFNKENEYYTSDIILRPFTLANIDDMRNFLLSNNTLGTQVLITDGDSEAGNVWNEDSGTDGTGLPYTALVKSDRSAIGWNSFDLNGLVVKTYQSDLFNNWLDTEFIDGENGISAISSVAVVNNKFSMDALNMAEKVYEYLNRVLVSGGTYEDWQEATYGEGAVRKAETPMYVGGMSAEVMFEEVVSNSETNIDGDYQPLGSLGGKGTQVGKNGGNNIHIKCEEPSYIIGIASLTPRICYSQGNDWDLTDIDTIDDLHKPALDGIGFQDLLVERFAWWDTVLLPGSTSVLHRSSAGKQTAWINYQTAVDKCYGDFAKQDGYSFMVLNRNYEIGESALQVKDVTTYIDPSKFNYAFAYSELAAQNFWVQIHSKVIARRKMGAQQIPNL